MKQLDLSTTRFANRPCLLEPKMAALMARVGMNAEPGDAEVLEHTGRIAIVEARGILLHRAGTGIPGWYVGYDGIVSAVAGAIESGAKAVMLVLDSPGGEVAGAFDAAEQLHAMRGEVPIWAIADEQATSGAYLLASAADRVIVPRTAQIGSIGVVTAHMDHSQMLENAGLKVTLIHAGAHKVDGNPYQALPESVRSRVQKDLDELYRGFVGMVARFRGVSERKIRDTQARIYMGKAAGRWTG